MPVDPMPVESVPVDPGPAGPAPGAVPMIVTLSPMRRDDRLQLHRRGPLLAINDQVLDLSGVTEDSPLAAATAGCDWLAGDIRREGEALHLTLTLPHGPVPFPPPPEAAAVLYPAPVVILQDGPVSLPAWDEEGGGAG
ncbi:hypothetical protein SAMN05421774_11131 [Gemmobacter megaterium]|uniref:Uncharacterized protein n=1 Tax=Gemmobacter megaterium TaxID=1086013 RepID=A0A1N7QI26_9RHOB|nr:hypothetical protein [Gemmobacter megaterium]GGE26313.1 hypothetical protein GCM10011345_35330 [Gemmobacter megaterium]SIT22167.1 hypothetical protein SAMN05421774_11131 [Gemmobacter megaterium]